MKNQELAENIKISLKFNRRTSIQSKCQKDKNILIVDKQITEKLKD